MRKTEVIGAVWKIEKLKIEKLKIENKQIENLIKKIINVNNKLKKAKLTLWAIHPWRGTREQSTLTMPCPPQLLPRPHWNSSQLLKNSFLP